VDGILFTGSWSVGRALTQATLDQPGKILALEMGGKNAMIVWRDADLRLAAVEAALSIASTTGQRCSCLSRIFVHRAVEQEFTERLVRVLSGLRIGPPLDTTTFMGPLVSRAAFDKVTRYRALAAEAGAERIFRGEVDRIAPYVAPALVRFESLAQTHPYQREEIFGPEATLYPVSDLDEAIAAVNDSDFGLAASVITRDRSAFDHCVGRIQTGVLNWNRGTIGASAKLPFGGGKKSGNHRPAAILATLYCTEPQSLMLNEAGYDPKSLPPGVPEP
jgi:succinylglutamic semialdehyde dehydrogenase